MKELRLKLKENRLRRLKRRHQFKLVVLERMDATLAYIDTHPRSNTYIEQDERMRHADLTQHIIRMAFLEEDMERLKL